MVRKPSQIQSLAEFEEPVNVLLYGDAGVGKTPFGAGAPECLIITTEPGVVSARRLGQKADVWSAIDSWDEFVKAYRWVHDNPDHGYEWLVIDNSTQLQENMIRAIVALARKNNSNRDEDIPAIQDYQKWYLMFDRFVKQVNALPVKTLWLAHAMKRIDPEGEEIIMPAIQGQDYAQAAKFCGRMMSIGFMEQRLIKKNDKSVFQNRIQWRKTQTYTAKDRYLFRKDVGDRYTICSEGDKVMTDMAEISRRIDAARQGGAVKSTTSGRRPAKKAAPRKAATTRATTRRRATSR